MESMDPQVISQLISTLGIGGVLVWYLYYTTTVTMPQRDQHYTDAITAITESFTDTLKEEREFRREETKEMKQIVRDHRCMMSSPVHPTSKANGS
jgi:hypothetical protein